MYGPNRSTYGGYDAYWGDYGSGYGGDYGADYSGYGGDYGSSYGNSYSSHYGGGYGNDYGGGFGGPYSRNFPGDYTRPPPPPPPPNDPGSFNHPPLRPPPPPPEFNSKMESAERGRHMYQENKWDNTFVTPSFRSQANAKPSIMSRLGENPTVSPNTEQNKPVAKTKTKRSLPVSIDPNMPEDLAQKFSGDACELCNVKLNSQMQAKNHYEGKSHIKRVKNFIQNAQYEGRTFTKLPKLDPPAQTKKKSEPLDISQLYCKCCDLSFTSEQHAQQHFMGRNHQRVLHGLKALKAGYYNKDTGKWQRTPPDPTVAAERIKPNNEESSENNVDPDNVKERGKFFCQLCNVSATSQDQLDGHMAGQRHMKNLKAYSRKESTGVPGTISVDDQ